MKGLFIFRRDLRYYDNIGLKIICDICDEVYAIFILDPRQISPTKNEYFSYNAFRFMLQSLKYLKRKIPLVIRYGMPDAVIADITKSKDIDVLCFNGDYTPFSIKRDRQIGNAFVKALNTEVIEYSDISQVPDDIDGNAKYILMCSDLCLNDPHEIKPYKVFTPYYNLAKKNKVHRPVDVNIKKIKKLGGKTVNIDKLIGNAEKKLKAAGMDISLIPDGGRDNGLKMLKKFQNSESNKYGCNSYKNRDMLTYTTSRLGPYIKFGTISVREVYYACNKEIFRRQLYWRDFYMQIGYHFPKVFGNNFKGHVDWKNSKALFDKWCNGKTGFKVVDACMNELNKSGYMHNRGRMIVASFLTKLLHINWKWGEKYFAQKLTDYDPCNNNGGWQWSAGTGVDAQPYFRIFNPYTQQSKFDPKCEYINKWLDNKEIDEIIDYRKEREIALTLYKNTK
jgi:deoxyribodipyrimidine photo-lyase